MQNHTKSSELVQMLYSDVRPGHFQITTGAISVPLVILLELIDTGAEFTAGRGGHRNRGHWRPDKEHFALHANSGFN